jgi:alkylhydroperoxidase family enzyme
MARVADSADAARALVPPALDAWEFMRDEVLRGGLVDPELKRLCFRFVAEDVDVEAFAGRERLALEWAHAIVWDSDAADDALWERLHAEFTEPELVELGCSIGFALGQQHWERTLGLPPRAGLE